jgi:glycosyltransferase involved in cell wall biosynthesis
MKKGAYTMASFLLTGIFAFFLLHSTLLKGGQKELNIAKKVENVLVQKEFIVVVPSFNNDHYFERNLSSIFSQDYPNYHVIYIDDNSTDNTFSEVSEYIRKNGFEDKVTLIHNATNQKALYNLYRAILGCKNDQIIVLLDGDDWFATNHVLSDLNNYYQNDDMWMSYGQYIRHPDKQIGMCTPVTKEFLSSAKMRHEKWQYSHLRTFYAGLFKKIRLEDLVEEGKFYTAAWDLAIMFPMMEMAREHVFFTPDILYVYNFETPLNDEKIRAREQQRIEKAIRAKPVYKELKEDPRKPFQECAVDLVAFSYNRPMQLYALLESLQKHVTGLRKIGIIYREDDSFVSGYDLVKKSFPEVVFFKQSNERPKEDFKPLVLEATFGEFGKGASYIVFAVDDMIITDKIDIQKGIKDLQEAHAYGLYYRLGKHIDYCYTQDYVSGVPELIEVGNGSFAWQFKQGSGDWNYPNSVDLVLYNKNDIKQVVEGMKYTFPNNFEGEWSKHADANKIGLCYERAKMVNVTMNFVTSFRNRATNSYLVEELNQMFLEGLKIDIDSFFHIMNRAPHTDVDPQFVTRG